jgi:hypothetical protein
VEAAAEADEPEAAGAGDPGLAAERDRLARALRETRLQLAMTQARLSALEQSATMELGRTLVRATRRPWSRGVQLPADLVRLWRERGGLTGPGAATLALASAQLGDLAGGGERFLSALTVPGLGAPGAEAAGWTPPGLVITGVLSARACDALAPDAAVLALLPHDADVMLESAGADLVLIEAAAMLTDSPWAYAGDPAAADRGRRLGRLIAAARALGKPVIFVRNVPAHLAPSLDWVGASCDAVSDDGFGVPLARFNPIGLAPSRPGDPVYADERDPREPPAVRALLNELTAADVPRSVRMAGSVRWRRRPELYWEHALFVTASAEQAREQLACGARVIMIGGEPVAGVTVRRPFEEHLVEGPGPIRAPAVAGLLTRLDAEQTHDLVVLRGRAMTAAVAKSDAFAGRLWPYLTDVPQSVPGLTPEGADELGRIASAARYLLCQTEELRCFLEGSIPAACGKCVLLPPILADEPAARASAAAGTPLRLVYTGKFAPRWNTLEMTELPGLLSARGVTSELHMAGDKIHDDATGYQQRMRDALGTDGVTWHGGHSREEAMRLAASCDIGLSWRHPDLDASLELSTKVLEFGALGLPVILNRTPMHEALLGADYPLFAASLTDAATAAAAAAAEPGLYRLAADRTGRAARQFTLDRAAERLRGYLAGAVPRVGWGDRGGQGGRPPDKVAW